MEQRRNLHLMVSLFLYQLGSLMVLPSITDILMGALCPGQHECGLVIYLAGFQQAIAGMGNLIVTPLVGCLADAFDIKPLLTIPMSIGIFPSAILACSQSKQFVIAYYLAKTLTSIICDGSIICLSLVYVADNTSEGGRATAFGLLSGTSSCAFVCATLASRFLSRASAFQLSTLLGAIALLYMRFLLPEVPVVPVPTASIIAETGATASPEMVGERKTRRFRRFMGTKKETLLRSRSHDHASHLPFRSFTQLHDLISMWTSSSSFSQASGIAFLVSLGDSGLHSTLLYYLRAQYQFGKDQFAELMLINGIAGAVSQLFIMPILAAYVGEERLLSVGLFANCVHAFLYALAWTNWVPYVAAFFGLMIVMVHPCIRSIVSKQVGPDEQGKAQGCISGICSLANTVSPLVVTPLTALFLSAEAPFHFPGFSIMCTGLVMMAAFVQSCTMRAVPPISALSSLVVRA
ncbi:uncharacterized protein LOC116248948 [Nymphaea colorata]|nr:uncharacterized protein LOC116248948 [Nymphaea colorata]